MTTGDFDGDGFCDVLVANRGSGDVTYLRGSSGGLVRAGEIPVGNEAVSLASGDFDKDGFTDAVVTNIYTDNMGSYWPRLTHLRGGIGGPSRVQDVEGLGSDAVTSNDFDGDGFLEVLVANGYSDSVTYIHWSGGYFSPGREIGVKDVRDYIRPSMLATGDFDGDGIQDLVVASYESSSLTYLRGGRDGLVLPAEELIYNYYNYHPVALAAGDFDGNGFPDLVVAGVGTGWVYFVRGGREGLSRAPGVHTGASSVALATGDFDGDGFLDIVVADGSNNLASIRGGREGLVLSGEFTAGDRPLALAAADYDGDGFCDAVAANMDSDDITYLRGGPGGLIRIGEIAAGDEPVALTSGDFDGDGIFDVVVANRESKDVTFLRGSEDGLQRIGEIPAKDPQALLAGDFDGDGFLDVVVTNPVPDDVTYLRGGPDGLQRKGEIPAGIGPIALTSGDFDGDGFLDVMAASANADGVTLLRGCRAGLVKAGEFGAGDQPVAVTAGDFDGDGFPDVVVANGLSDDITYLRQRRRVPHPNALLDPSAPSGFPASLSDPRNPSQYRLEVSREALPSQAQPLQACLVPGPIFALPQAEACRRGKYLLAVTDPMSLLRETTLLASPARLVLRLRDDDPQLLAEALGDPGRLRVLRRDPATGVGSDAGLAPGKLEVVDLVRGKGVAFPVTRFGAYQVAIERDR